MPNEPTNETASAAVGQPVREHAELLLNALRELKRRDDRGALANLRRSTNPATAQHAWPLLSRWCDLTNDRQRTIVATVSAAFAASGGENDTSTGNFGISLRLLAGNGGVPSPEDLKSRQSTRLRRLLACDSAEEVCRHAAGLLRYFGQQGIRVNYEQLYEDLWYWDKGEWVRLRWAQAYWNGAGEKDIVPAAEGEE